MPPRETGTAGRISRRDMLKATAGATTVGLVGLAGCTGNTGNETTTGSEETTTTTETTAGSGGGSQGETVKVGWLYPLTGPYGGLAKYQRQGARLAVKQLNDSGGVDGTRVELFEEDTQADPQTAKQKARKLVNNDGVDTLMGCISSAAGSAVAAFAEEQNLPYFPDIAADEITMENCRRTTFRYETRASQTAAAAASWAVENFGTKIWIHNADYLWGNSVGEAWKREAKAAGNVEIVGETKSDLGASDFSTYISQIAASDADWVVTGVNGGDAVNFLKQAGSFGLKDSVTIVSPVNSFQFIRKAAGTDAVGTYSAVRYYENFDSDVNREFVKAFSDEYGQPPDNFAHISWVYINMYANAVKETGGTEPDPIIDALPGMEFDTAMGTTSFRECDHQAARPYSLGKIVEPADYEWPDIEIQKTVPADEATVPCEETGCSL